jgi:radical SAM-linked protein
LTYRIQFEVRGRARFLSHLETVDTLLSALRRGGYQIALSHGMKPRPVISLALPRAVGVESEAELADVELVGEPHPADVATALAAQLPEGLAVAGVEHSHGKPASSRLRGVDYTVDVDDDLDWDEAIARYNAAEEAVVTRTAPAKADKRVDVKRFCTSVEHEPGRLLLELALTGEGTARPEEVANAVAANIGATPTIRRLVRTRIALVDAPTGVTT